jgi:hypothetical protein
VAYRRDMMNGYDMSGWGWFAMSMMAIGTVAIVALVVWAITVRRAPDPEPRERSPREQP